MELTIELACIFFLLGIVAGFLAGLLGTGGASFILPIFTIYFIRKGISQDTSFYLSLGTVMAITAFTMFSSMLAQRKRGGIVYSIAKVMIFGAVLGVFFSTFLATKINPIYLSILLIAFMSYGSYSMFTKKRVELSKEALPKPVIFICSYAIGTVSGLISVGGGILMVPFLMWQNIDIKKAIGTSSAVGFFITTVGTFGYILNGLKDTNLENIDYTFGYLYLPAVFIISIASFLAAPFGVKLVYTLPVILIKRIFGFVSLGLALKMFFEIV
ncbi:MAG: sulfite exporter TauE/SafE family protein [Campylobacteraceae bacterium]